MFQTLSTANELKKKLIEEAERKAREIIEEAEREARSIIENAEREWREKAENERKKLVEQAEREASRILSEARVKARLVISNAKNTVFNEIFSEVVKRIESRENIDIYKSLRNLLDESLTYVTKPARICVDSRDVEIAKKLINEKKLGNVELIPLDNLLGGVIIEDSEGRRIDNSYRTRLERARKTLGSDITKHLWSKVSR